MISLKVMEHKQQCWRQWWWWQIWMMIQFDESNDDSYYIIIILVVIIIITVLISSLLVMMMEEILHHLKCINGIFIISTWWWPDFFHQQVLYDAAWLNFPHPSPQKIVQTSSKPPPPKCRRVEQHPKFHPRQCLLKFQNQVGFIRRSEPPKKQEEKTNPVLCTLW